MHFCKQFLSWGKVLYKETFSHDLICDPIGIVVILIILKVPPMSGMLGSSAFLCLAVA